MLFYNWHLERVKCRLVNMLQGHGSLFAVTRSSSSSVQGSVFSRIDALLGDELEVIDP